MITKKLESIKTKNLKKAKKLAILKLKDQEWKYGIKNQDIWFKKNIKLNDTHNLLFLEKKLIGYNCIRSIKLDNKKYLLFDTIVIKKKFRDLNYSSIIMRESIKIIKERKKICLLVCNRKLVKYYKNFNWKSLRQKLFPNLNRNRILMYYK
jgi:predicted GNAT family N-acyltransferase